MNETASAWVGLWAGRELALVLCLCCLFPVRPSNFIGTHPTTNERALSDAKTTTTPTRTQRAHAKLVQGKER
jgi:hypothetical protein